MGRQPSAPSSRQPVAKAGQVLVPQKNVDIVKEALGIDLVGLTPERLSARMTATVSTSSSPYTSAEMLEEYVSRGMADVRDRVLDTIDEERRWRHARMEQDQAHVQAVEMEEAALERTKVNEAHFQQRRSQMLAFSVAVLGILGSAAGAYFKLPTSFCISLALICVGGPAAATVVARFTDRPGGGS